MVWRSEGGEWGSMYSHVEAMADTIWYVGMLNIHTYVCADLSSASHSSATRGVMMDMRSFGAGGGCMGGASAESTCMVSVAWAHVTTGTTIEGEIVKVSLDVSKEAIVGLSEVAGSCTLAGWVVCRFATT